VKTGLSEFLILSVESIFSQYVFLVLLAYVTFSWKIKTFGSLLVKVSKFGKFSQETLISIFETNSEALKLEFGGAILIFFFFFFFF
jgi:hypothetical protein